MTAPIDLSELSPEPIGVPDHTATGGPIPAESSGESGKPGIFGQRTRRGPTKARKLAAAPKAEKEAPPKLSASVRGQIEDLYSGIGAMIKPFDEFTGQTLIDQAKPCAESVYALAQSNDAVRRFILSITTTTVVGAVIFAHLPILLALARHSSNDRVKMAAGMTYAGLKMQGAGPNPFADSEDKPSE